MRYTEKRIFGLTTAPTANDISRLAEEHNLKTWAVVIERKPIEYNPNVLSFNKWRWELTFERTVDV